MKVVSNKYTFPNDFEQQSLIGSTSTVWVSNDKMYVIKFVNKYTEYDVYQREVFILRKLNALNFDWCPKLIECNDTQRYIVTTYCGEEINTKNKPINTQIQLTNILYDLRKHGIKHNDIKQSEILVKNDKIYICDFGWCTLNDSWSMGINLNNSTKPFHYYEDETLFKRMPWLLETTYLNESRKQVNGSQMESPNVILRNDLIHVTGYQRYAISIENNDISTNSKKMNRQLEILKGVGIGKTVLDIGCSNGFFGFYFLLNRSDMKCYDFMDHDKECITLIDKVAKTLRIPNTKYNLVNQNFTEFILTKNTYETITALSVIHWLYSCTTTIGCLNDIIQHLRRKTTSTLVIEWVDPKDNAIKSFNHLKFNKAHHKSEYSRINFEHALKVHFRSYTCYKDSSLTGTRDIYVAFC